MKKITKKLLASVLTFIIFFAELSTLGMYGIAYATEARDTATSNQNVEFDVYFANEKREIVSDVNTEDAKMYLNIKVKEAGYLKNGIVSFSSANFNVKTGFENEYIQEIKEDKIYLKQLDTNSNILIELPIIPKKDDIVSADNFIQESKVRIDGTYVNAKGKEIAIEKEHTVKLILNGEAKIVAEATINKYVPYKLGEEYGVILQYKIKTGLENNNLPIKTTELQVKVPTINENTPNDIKVMANNTKATNGKEDGIDFVQTNWNYNEETKLVDIKVENILENNNITWKKNCTDEYLVTFKYEGKEIYDYVNSTEKFNVSTDFTAKIEAYNNIETIKEQEFTGKAEITKKINEIVDFNIEATKEISKGHIYANFNAKEKVETSYTVKYTANIAYANLINAIEFTQEADNYKDGTTEYSTVVSNKNEIYTTKISVSENVFNKILGTEGYIDIFNPNLEKVGTINKQSLKDGLYTFDCKDLDLNKLTLKTSAPTTEGTLNIYVEKSIKGENGYSKEEIKSFKEINASVIGKTELAEQTKQGKIALKEPISKAELTISKNNLSTITVNENVEIRATLDTSNINNSLYKNPTIKLVFPKYFEKIEISDAKLLFENELKLKNNNWSTENGNKVLTLSFEGTQTKYNSEATTKGATISILADITLEKLTPSMQEKIKMYYTNENTDLYETSNITPEGANTNNETISVVRAKANSNAQEIKGMVKADVNFVVPTGVMVSAGIDNYKEGASGILSITDESLDVEIAPFANKRIATVKGTLTNNNTNPISNVCILGRFPSQGNKKIDSTDDLGNTTTFSVSKAISVLGMDTSKIEVYYSEKTDANKDLKDTSNGWTTSQTDLTKAKSYLIVLKDKIEATGTIEFNYEIELPNNIGYNKNAATMYKTYYTNEASEATMEESKQAPILNLTTGKGPELEIKLSSSAASDGRVFNGQYVRLYVEVKNTGKLDITNAKLIVGDLINAKFSYLEDSSLVIDTDYLGTMNLETIKSGQSKTVSYEILCQPGLNIKNDGEDEIDEEKLKEVSVPLKLTADNIEGEIPAETYKLTFYEDAKRITINNTVDAYEDLIYQSGDEINYTIDINNKTDADINNVEVTIPLPNGSKVEDTYIESGSNITKDGINIKSDKVIVNISKMPATSTMKIYVKFILGDNLPESFSTKVSLTDGTYTYLSNEKYIYTGKISITAEQVDPVNQYIKEREGFVYSFKITANSSLGAENVTLEVNLPKEAKYTGNTVANIKTGDIVACRDEYDINTKTLKVTIPQIANGVTLEANIYVTAELESEEDDGKAIVNSAKIYGNNIEEIALNPVTYYLEYNPNKEDDGTIQNGYKISGTAWIDSNKNGQRDNDEATLSNVKVMLLYKKNNQIVTSETGEKLIVTTDDSGKYEFRNIKSNEYLAVFVYDTSRYTITTYQKDGVQASKNSDAINMEVILDGEKTRVGMTDTIVLKNSNIRNIDIGLYGEEKFDLRLDKYISKIKLTTPTIGTKEYNYDNSTFEKIEVLRQNVDKSSIVIEYKIVVTNEGALPGYVNKIIDYLPKDVNFNTELNKDWYLSKDSGCIYNTSLDNQKINPGESREVSLILTKKITKSSIGSVVCNMAEIYQATNEAGLPDIDSEQANKLETEDDLGTANIILSIVTGKIVGYITIIIIAAGIIATGIIIIKKKVLTKIN